MDIFIEGSMRTIFSMLFGAGLLIFINKPNVEAKQSKNCFTDTLLLVAFGLFNSYILLWLGDILYAYGMTGLVLYWLRDLPAGVSGNKCSYYPFSSVQYTANHMYSASLVGQLGPSKHYRRVPRLALNKSRYCKIGPNF